ncbi:MAG: hypothetical protein LBL90_02950 [Prevotellaceae bacterium]|nr:hypothetical protein [Prevotellaceae bacterium]
MKNIFIYLILFLFPYYSLGQQKDIMKVDWSTNLSHAVDRPYPFDNFTDGRVIYKDGSAAMGKLNYSIFVVEFQFVAYGDILAVKDPDKIALAVIGNRTLVKLKKGFGVIIAESGSKQLILKKEINVKIPAKMGAYGAYNPTSSIDTYHSLSIKL